jgi:hypothetical protein
MLRRANIRNTLAAQFGGGFLTLVVFLLSGTLPALASDPVASPDPPAAILVYPYIVTDASLGEDTIVEVTNVGQPVSVECFYVGGDGPQAQLIQFSFHLTTHQPVAWRASSGLSQFVLGGVPIFGVPQQGNGNSFVPAIPSDTFVGSLRCITVDGNGYPVAVNALVGSARIEQYESSSPQSLRIASYRAVGIQALPGTGTSYPTLILGGPGPQYQACPSVLILDHFEDGATLESTGQPQQVTTTIALVPCSVNLASPGDSNSVLLLEQYNEFGQVTGTRQTMGTQLVRPLSELGAGSGGRSLFQATVQGTLMGQTRITSAEGSAPLGVAIESHRFTDSDHVSTAAFTLYRQGNSSYQDVITFPVRVDPTPPPTEIPTATPVPTATDPPLVTATCDGDCDGSGDVTVVEIITMLNITLGTAGPSACPNGIPAGAKVDISLIIQAVNHALNQCPS